MLNILVPTDFSNNSKAGLRFAIQWSTQQKIHLHFIHVFHAVKMPQWSDEEFEKYASGEAVIFKDKLEKFVSGIYKAMDTKPGRHTYIVRQGYSADISLMDYCRSKGDFDYICMATRGASKLGKLFGTHTGNLITKSEVPVIAIPKNYRTKEIRSILFATDFTGYDKELDRVLAFARPLKAKVDVFHLSLPQEVFPDEETLESGLNKRYPYGINLEIEPVSPDQSLLPGIREKVQKSRHSLVVMFTEQHRNLLDRFFFPSLTELLSFNVSSPMLVFHKS